MPRNSFGGWTHQVAEAVARALPKIESGAEEIRTKASWIALTSAGRHMLDRPAFITHQIHDAESLFLVMVTRWR